MRVRSEQMKSLKAHALKETSRRIAGTLRESLPQETSTLGIDELERVCARGISRAGEYGIGVEYNLYVFVAAMVLFGEDFDIAAKTAWSRQILQDAGMHENLKTKLLELRIQMDTERGL